MKKLVSRFNSNSNRFEIGYWVGTKFIIIQTAKAV